MSTDTKIKTLIFNKLTQEQYNNADRVPTEFYLTPDDTDEKLAAKQDKLIAGTNITIEGNVISATGGSTTAGRPLGEVYFSQSSLTTDNPGALPGWTGEYYENGKTLFPDLYNFVKAHSELQVTKAQYDSAIATYGECPKYVVDENTAQTSLRLPKYANYIKMANSTEGITQKGAGLPNITGDWNSAQYMDAWSSNGAVYGIQNNSAEHNSSSQGMRAYFDASRSNPIYGASDTVQPAHTTLYPWISAYTSAIPASVSQAAEFTGALSGKANTDLSNVSANIDYVVDYKNPTADDPSWYRVYKSGWVEQGGVIPATEGNITFLKPFANINYTVVGNISLTYRRAGQGDGSGSVLFFPEATSFCYVTWAARNFGDIGNQNISWRAEGQGAQ